MDCTCEEAFLCTCILFNFLLSLLKLVCSFESKYKLAGDTLYSIFFFSCVAPQPQNHTH